MAPESTLPTDDLRLLAAADPRAAVQRVSAMFDSPNGDIERLLKTIAGPSDGRLRQIVASAVRLRQDRDRAAPYLRAWLSTESDEFTRRAILHALEGIGPAEPAATSSHPQELVSTYRYVAGRLAHQVRNALMLPMQQLGELRGAINELSDRAAAARLGEILQQSCDGFDGVGRIVEFDTSDEFFAERPVVLRDWLVENNPKLLAGGPIDFEWRSDESVARVRVVASSMLLTVLFRNIWANAREAVSGTGRCRIEIVASAEATTLNMIVTDNGPGFPPVMRGTAFRVAHSTRAGSRGRGLPEIGDAVERLRGSAALCEVRPSELRLKIAVPMEEVWATRGRYTL